MERDYSKVPEIQIPFETLDLMVDLLEPIEFKEIMIALKRYFKEGVEPDFEKQTLRGVWKNVLAVVKRRADKYLNKTEAGTNNFDKINKARQQKKTIPVENNEFVDYETGEILNAPQEGYMNDTGLTTGLPDGTLIRI